MKILIISDDSELVSKTKSFFKGYGFDTIIYKWLLKALDNIEEIQPDVIILSSTEYPRHWKTLVQFAKSGIGGEKVDVFLYEPIKLSKEDEDKAKALGISGTFGELENIALKDIFKEYLKNNNNLVLSDNDSNDELPTVDSILNDVEKPGYVLITNPIHNNLVCGKVLSKNENKIEIELDYSLVDVQNNDNIKLATYFNEIECYSFNAEIYILNDEKKNIILSIQEIYEEK